MSIQILVFSAVKRCHILSFKVLLNRSAIAGFVFAVRRIPSYFFGFQPLSHIFIIEFFTIVYPYKRWLPVKYLHYIFKGI